MKKLILLFAIIAVVFGCSNDNQSDPVVSKIELDKTELNMKIHENYNFKVDHLPNNIPAHQYIWTSSNPDIVSVDNGYIKALSLGESTIKVVSVKNKDLYSSCLVKVSPIIASSVRISDTIKIKVDEENVITYTIMPENATFKNIVWSIKNPSIATIDESGKIKGVSIGQTEAIINIKDTNISDTCIVDVVSTPVIGLKYDSYAKILVGRTDKINASVQPENATNKKLIWSSSDERIATVTQEGIVSGHSIGDVKIIIKAEEGKFEGFCPTRICGMDEMVEASLVRGFESNSLGNTWTLTLSFSSPSGSGIKIQQIILSDENGAYKNSASDIGTVPVNYEHKFIIKTSTGTVTGDFMFGQGWKAQIVYYWNNIRYDTTIVTK